MNILCANRECRKWYNYLMPFGRLDDLNRVEPIESYSEKSENGSV